MTGVLYFNYTAVVNKVIEDNLEDKEFCIIMKLCLKDGIVKAERVHDIIEKYRFLKKKLQPKDTKISLNLFN